MKITLCNTIFDKENDNVLLFNSKNDVLNYINKQEDKVVVSNINFDAKNIINTSVYVRINNDINLLNILNYNYCVVENDDKTDVLFYFILEASQDSGSQIRIDLQIDAFNTYILPLLNSTKKCQGLVERTHQDRFTKIPNDTNYTYNFDKHSSLFERESLQNTAKRVVAKQKLNPLYDDSGVSSDFNEWFQNNLMCWLYVYFPAQGEYNWIDANGQKQQTGLADIEYKKGENSTRCGLACMCVPLVKGTKRIKIVATDTEKSFYWDAQALTEFLANNNGYAKVISIKQSIFPPFYTKPMTNYDFEIDTNGDLNFKTKMLSVDNARFLNVAFYNSATEHAIGAVEYQDLNKNLRMAPKQTFFQNTYTKDDIINNNPIVENEPKIYNEDYSIYRVYFGGEAYNLPISKTNDNIPHFKYFEILSPDITKFYLSYDFLSGNNPLKNWGQTIFTNDTLKDWTGLVGTLDLSLWFATSKLDEFLASNKNNLQIFNNNQASAKEATENSGLIGIAGGILTGMASGALAGSMGGPLGAAGGAVVGGFMGGFGKAAGFIGNATSQEIQQDYQKDNYNLTLDNMRQAPAKMSTINSNSLLLQIVDDLGIFIELQQTISFELNGLRENLKLFGYNYNRIADIKDLIKTRKYYNYIQANVFEIDAKISENVKDLIKSIFKKGIRVWYSDTFTGEIDFNLNNYERSLK